MTSRILLDTNVLVYAYDRSEPIKQTRAWSVLDQLATLGLGVVTTQVLGEFFVVVTCKLKAPLSVAEASERVQNHVRTWTVVELTALVVQEAIRGVRDYSMSYYDAQIWAAARLNQIPAVFSEDFPSGSVVEGVQFVNPFADDFDLNDWVL